MKLAYTKTGYNCFSQVELQHVHNRIFGARRALLLKPWMARMLWSAMPSLPTHHCGEGKESEENLKTRWAGETVERGAWAMAGIRQTQHQQYWRVACGACSEQWWILAIDVTATAPGTEWDNDKRVWAGAGISSVLKTSIHLLQRASR